MSDAFDWISFFNEYSIPYVTTGPNVSAGRAAIRCPFCGSDDPSEHLVVNLEGRNWWCWRRRAEHKGGSPEYLIQNLIHCSFDQARVLTGGVALGEDFLSQVQKQFSTGDAGAIAERRVLKLPDNFKSFHPSKPSARPFVEYLMARGFTRNRILGKFTRRYNIRYCTAGPYQGRIIFPVSSNDKLVSWTGRSVSKKATLRYKALTTDEEKAREEGLQPALGPISHYLLWYDTLMRVADDYTIICLCEGPFDALKIRELGRDYGITATCFFTSAPTEPQIGLLHELLPRFKRKYLLLDSDMVPNALRVTQELSSLGVVTKHLPRGIKDPGVLRDVQFLLN